MKTFVLASMLFFVTSATFAELPAYSVSQEIDHSVESISSEEVQELKANKMNNCFAYTYCFGGRTIQCNTLGLGCSYYVQPGQYVQCSGYNRWGQWVNTQATCY